MMSVAGRRSGPACTVGGVSAGELAIVLGTVLCALGFAALVVVLVRVLDALADLQGDGR